jgi:hypothetical protein
LLALASSILVLPAVPSSAESMCTATLVVTSGEFTDPTAWSSGSVPGPGDYACVPRTTKATLSTNGTVDGVSIAGTLDGAGTLTVSDGGTPDVSQLTGIVSTAGLTIAAGSLVVDEAWLSGSSTLSVSPGATARVISTSGLSIYGLSIRDTASAVIDGTLVLEASPARPIPLLTLGLAGTQLVVNGTVDLRNGADIDGRQSTGIRVGQSGLLRSSTAGQNPSSVNAPVELAGRVDAAAGTLQTILPITTAPRSSTALLSTSGGSLEVGALEAGIGSRATIEGTGVTLYSLGITPGGGAGDIVVGSGLLHIITWTPKGSGSLHVMPGAAAEVTTGAQGGWRSRTATG